MLSVIETPRFLIGNQFYHIFVGGEPSYGVELVFGEPAGRFVNITMHIGNAYKEGELAKESTCKEYLQVQQEGKRKVTRKVKFYDLDVIT